MNSTVIKLGLEADIERNEKLQNQTMEIILSFRNVICKSKKWYEEI